MTRSCAKDRGAHLAISRTYRGELQEHKGELTDEEHPPAHTCAKMASQRWGHRRLPPCAAGIPPHFNMFAYVGAHEAAVKTDTMSPPMYAGKGSA